MPSREKIWREKLSERRELFQTTTQRWFADPILSATRAPGDGGGVGDGDRTLRTVFSHDHFGPSSIQQHGFYTALVIEPQTAQICSERGGDCTTPRADRTLVNADDRDIGARKIIRDLLPLNPDAPEYREFALSIADFSTLYDPRDTVDAAALEARMSEGDGDGGELMKGMAMLVCEARHAAADQPHAMAEFCGSGLHDDGYTVSGADGDVPPAWLAARRPGDAPAHSRLLEPNLLSTLDGPDELDALEEHLIAYRRMAAGYAPDDPSGRLAKPVAAPARPEGISVDHHDPYLVNYRGEPLALRFGESSSSSSDCELKGLSHWASALETGVTERCAIRRQKGGIEGDLANVFLSPIQAIR